jgi:hypothetical protein
MAALMVPGSKPTDLWGRRRCFVLGLVIYGIGALLAAFAPGLLLVGYDEQIADHLHGHQHARRRKPGRNTGMTSASTWHALPTGCPDRPIIRTCHQNTTTTRSRPATSRRRL